MDMVEILSALIGRTPALQYLGFSQTTLSGHLNMKHSARAALAKLVVSLPNLSGIGMPPWFGTDAMVEALGNLSGLKVIHFTPTSSPDSSHVPICTEWTIGDGDTFPALERIALDADLAESILESYMLPSPFRLISIYA